MNYQTIGVAVAALTAAAVASAQAPARMRENAVFFSGQVAFADGTKVSEPIRVKRTCKGNAQEEIWTDSTGRFSFKATNDNDSTSAGGAENATRDTDLARPIGNSTYYSNPVTSSLRDCEVQAVLNGYWSDRVSLALKTTLDSTRLGTIILHPVSRAEAFTVSATTLAAPSNAKKAYEKGLIAIRDQHWDAAAADFTKAVTAYPKYAIAWFELGLLREGQNDTQGANAAWLEALKADPKYVKPYEGLAAVAQKRQNWVDAEKYSRDWIQLDPEAFPAAYLYNAVANANLSKAAEAEAAARKGLLLDKEHRIARLSYVLGLILMQKQEYSESAKCLRTYLELAPNARDAAAVRGELAKLEEATVAPVK